MHRIGCYGYTVRSRFLDCIVVVFERINGKGKFHVVWAGDRSEEQWS
ncbi:hypothetical protein [Buchananella felis]